MQAGEARLEVEIVSTPEARGRGLMQREALPEARGMWFIFDNTDFHCLWMKNTPIPLSAAFVAEDGRVINLVDMDPETEYPHCASAPARFVLEVNRGWFARHGVAPGSWLLPPPH